MTAEQVKGYRGLESVRTHNHQTGAASGDEGNAGLPAAGAQDRDECRALDPLRQETERINTSLYCQTI